MSIFGKQWTLMQGDGGGDGSSGGGGDDKGGDKGGDKDKAPDSSETLLRGLAVIASGMSKMQESNEQLLTLLKEQAAQRGGGDDKGGDKSNNKGDGAGDDLFSGVDMEQLDRPQFAALMLSKFEERLQHHLKEAVKPFDEKLERVGSRLEDDLANREVNKIASEKPDFYEWRQEIGELVKSTPSLSVARAYTIARSENAEKAKKMDEKYTKKETKPEGFVGFSPTGGSGRGDGAGKMKFNEAAERAYNDVLASLGGVSLDQLPVVGGRH